ncbi:hypothetical protein A0U90_10985 [Kozakia baliensis]|nr:hypothetical protein A0U90_10985 [Kozakia baliensis]
MHFAKDVQKLSTTTTERFGRLEWLSMTLNEEKYVFAYMAKLHSGAYADIAVVWTANELRQELLAQQTTGIARFARIIANLGDAAEYALQAGIKAQPPSPKPSRSKRKANA